MPTVSLTMIVRDEEANLPACLASCAGLFDQLVIVDTGSTDRTKEIASAAIDKHGRPARVFDFAWCDDFAAARNESLRHATSDWVFWLDADDRIEPVQHPRIAYVLTSLNSPHAIYGFNSVCPDLPGKPELIVPQYRLFPRIPEARWIRRIHEYISLGNHEVIVYRTHVPIVHLGYLDPGITAAKSHRNMRLLRLACAENPDDHELLFYLGTECFRQLRFEEAEGLLSRSRAMCQAAGHQAPYEFKREEMLRMMQIGGSVIT